MDVSKLPARKFDQVRCEHRNKVSEDNRRDFLKLIECKGQRRYGKYHYEEFIIGLNVVRGWVSRMDKPKIIKFFHLKQKFEKNAAFRDRRDSSDII